MNLLDIKTVLFSYAASTAVSMMVIFMLWMQNRRRFVGLGFWFASFLMQFIGLCLMVARGSVPDFLSMTGSNVLLIGGTILLYMGLERFVGKPGTPIPNLILLAAFIPAHRYFAIIQPSISARTVLLMAGTLLLCFQCAWLAFYRVDAKMRSITHSIGVIFTAYCLVSIARILVNLIFPSNDNFFNSNPLDILLVMAYQLLFILLTLNLFLIVNSRLMDDLEQDISERKLVEEKLRLSEEKFFKAFQSSPDAVVLTRLTDEKVVEVNDGFSLLTEYSREEVLKSSPFKLGIWANSQDRETCVAELMKSQHVRNQEYEFRSKSGKTWYGLYSGEIIYIGDKPHALSIVRDVTERKQVEGIIQLRLRLNDFAATHSLDELMQKALDEIGDLTGSPIGFYHFVEPDQKTLSLQTWSTRTLQEFCHTEGKGMHYDIDQAGVWVDCVYQRKPVVHNDYASLPHRKGMPEGHAEVIREIVVPTMREGKVVSILGVGNKPTDYDEKDIELVTYIADVVWVLVERKRAEEKIHLLQDELREQAIRDPLTGLYNRRYLYETLERELARAEHENFPVSFVMIDIDHFKDVNDQFGHSTGDAVLQKLSSQLMSHTRYGDIVCRYGGEEFLAVLLNVTTEIAFQITERWRLSFLESPLLSDQMEAKATISCGISEFPIHGKTGKDLVAMADKAMYQAKAKGRNRVVIWQNKLQG